MSPPRISVLMTIYNGGRFLGPAVQSLLDQSFADFELVAVENGSSDGSVQAMRDFAARDARVRLIELERNIGRTPALIRALEEARGDLIAVQDADDISFPDRFEAEVAHLDAHPDCQLVGSWCSLIDENGQRIGELHPVGGAERAFQAMAHTNVVAHSSAMFRRASALAVGGYPPELPFGQDYGLWVRLMELGGIAVLERELAAIRQHGGNLSTLPSTVVVRSLDAIQSFKRVYRVAGLSDKSRRNNRRVVALESGRLALALMASGQWRQALGWGVYGFACDPLAFLGKMIVKTV